MSPWANVRGNLQVLASLCRSPWGARGSQSQGRLLRFLLHSQGKSSSTDHIVCLCFWSRAWFLVVTLDG